MVLYRGRIKSAVELEKRNTEIKKLHQDGVTSHIRLAKRFGVSRALIGQILFGRYLYCRRCLTQLDSVNAFNTNKCLSCKDFEINERLRVKRELQLLRDKILTEKHEAKMSRMLAKQALTAAEHELVPTQCFACLGAASIPRNRLRVLASYSIFCPECNAILSNFTGRDRAREIRRLRDSHTCQDCGKKWVSGTRRLDVHHLNGQCGKKSRSYDKAKDVEGLVSLCHKCHFRRPEHTLRLKQIAPLK